MNTKTVLHGAFIIVLFSVFNKPALAWLPPFLPTSTPTPKLLKLDPNIIKIIPSILVTTVPSATPTTIIPTATPIPPTITPLPPTVTATPVLSQIVTTSPTQASTTATVSPSLIPETKKGATQGEVVLGGIAGIFGLTILVLLWPKIKTFLHDKTA